MLCPFGQIRNGSVASQSIQFSSTATNSATNEYVAVPERIGQNEETFGRNEDWTKKKPSFSSKMYVNDAE